ncbi:hypothetical protein VVD49_05700 [Uliginosibacterium sp. H3]|uniref:Uncharacterized protein n=1 Tax=Uliginosibacterium silvisoli TaxID=3114758 RepID=A0ABU6K1C1_9RHOO|nr:hypothetical protein [Uliginosibacterium sp. H3]
MAEKTTDSTVQPLPSGMAAAACLAGIAALIALYETGLLRPDPPAPEDAVAAILAADPPAAGLRTEPALIAPGNATDRFGELDDKALREALTEANIHNRVGQEPMPDWLADDYRTFRRIGRAAARLLDGWRLAGTATDLEVIKHRYLEAIGRDGNSPLPFDARIDNARLSQAIVAAFNAQNGTRATRMEGIVEAR